jgi:hypothetical protein
MKINSLLGALALCAWAATAQAQGVYQPVYSGQATYAVSSQPARLCATPVAYSQPVVQCCQPIVLASSLPQAGTYQTAAYQATAYQPAANYPQGTGQDVGFASNCCTPCVPATYACSPPPVCYPSAPVPVTAYRPYDRTPQIRPGVFGQPSLFVPGQPIRNFFRSISL